MDIVEAIEGAEIALEDRLADLQMAKELVTSLEADVKKYRMEIVGLKSFAARAGLLGSEPQKVADNVHQISTGLNAAAPAGLEIEHMTRSEAVVAVMETMPDAVDRNQIHDLFHDNGRFGDSLDQISLALSGLKRNGRAQRLGHGLWHLVDEDPAAEIR